MKYRAFMRCVGVFAVFVVVVVCDRHVNLFFWTEATAEAGLMFLLVGN